MEDQSKFSHQGKNIVILSDFNDGATLCHVDKALRQVPKDSKPEDIDKKDELPLDVITPDEELGEKWNAVDTLRLLFRNSLLRQIDPSLLKYRILNDGAVLTEEENYYPVRRNPAMLTPELAETFRNYAEDLLPSPDDPDFTSALRYRISGVFAILHYFIHLIDEIRDPVLVLRWFASVTRDEDKQKITSFPWEQRQLKLWQRMNSVEASAYVLRAEHRANFIAGEIKKIADPETREPLNALFGTFVDKLNKCPFIQDGSLNPLSRYKYLHAVVDIVGMVLEKSKNLDTFQKLLVKIISRLPNIKDQKAAQGIYDWLKESEETSSAAS